MSGNNSVDVTRLPIGVYDPALKKRRVLFDRPQRMGYKTRWPLDVVAECSQLSAAEGSGSVDSRCKNRLEFSFVGVRVRANRRVQTKDQGINGNP